MTSSLAVGEIEQLANKTIVSEIALKNTKQDN